MFELDKYLTHPRQLCGLPRFGSLDHNNNRLFLPLLLYCRNFIRDEFSNGFPVMLASFGMKTVSARKEQLKTKQEALHEYTTFV